MFVIGRYLQFKPYKFIFEIGRLFKYYSGRFVKEIFAVVELFAIFKGMPLTR